MVAAAAPNSKATKADLREQALAEKSLIRARGDKAALGGLVSEAKRALAAGDRGTFYHTLGDLYRAQKLKHAAVDSYRTAVKIEPGSAKMHESLAEAYDAVGKKKAAEEERAAVVGLN